MQPHHYLLLERGLARIVKQLFVHRRETISLRVPATLRLLLCTAMTAFNKIWSLKLVRAAKLFILRNFGLSERLVNVPSRALRCCLSLQEGFNFMPSLHSIVPRDLSPFFLRFHQLFMRKQVACAAKLCRSLSHLLQLLLVL